MSDTPRLLWKHPNSRHHTRGNVCWWLLLCWLGLGWGEARNRVAEIAENAKPLAEHGGEYTKTGGRGNKLPDNCQVVLEKQYGNSAKDLTARIARDNPEVLR